MERRDEKIIRYTGANNQLLGIPTEGKGREWWGQAKKLHFITRPGKLVGNVYNRRTEKEQYNCIMFSYLVQK